MKSKRDERRRDVERKLMAWQPDATAIRRERQPCPHCHSSLYVSYIIPVCLTRVPMDETLEYCGFYCGSCINGQPGARKKT